MCEITSELTPWSRLFPVEVAQLVEIYLDLAQCVVCMMSTRALSDKLVGFYMQVSCFMNSLHLRKVDCIQFSKVRKYCLMASPPWFSVPSCHNFYTQELYLYSLSFCFTMYQSWTSDTSVPTRMLVSVDSNGWL